MAFKLDPERARSQPHKKWERTNPAKAKSRCEGMWQDTAQGFPDPREATRQDQRERGQQFERGEVGHDKELETIGKECKRPIRV